MDKIGELRSKLIDLDNETDWLSIANFIGMEKQIEIRAELLRAIKRINKGVYLKKEVTK